MKVSDSTKKIIFFNLHQNGDLYHSRGLVEWIVNNTDDSFEFWSAHKHANIPSINEKIKHLSFQSVNKEIYKDLYYIKFMDKFFQIDLSVNNQILDPQYQDIILVNTWIASSPSFISKYDNINVHSIYRQTIELVELINFRFGSSIPIPAKPEDVIPTAPSFLRKEKEVLQLLNKLNFNKYRKHILLCNGPVYSQQTPEFSISEKLKDVVLRNKDCAFLYTEKDREQVHDNEYFINDYISFPNLDEVNYISTFCDILVSRMSGPGCAICTKENFFNPNKSFICFTDNENFAHWYKNGSCKYDWTNDYSDLSIASMIEKHIRG